MIKFPEKHRTLYGFSKRRSDTRIRQKCLIFLLFPIIAVTLNLSDSRIRPTCGAWGGWILVSDKNV